MPTPFVGRVGLAGAPHHHKRACNLAHGELYTFPKTTDTIDATQPLTFKWNTACTLSSSIDLYLYDSSGLIKGWKGVDYSLGEYKVTLQPKWWNDTTTARLQMNIVGKGEEPWNTGTPAGPVFAVNYAAASMYATATSNGQVVTSTAAGAATQSKDTVFENVSSANSSDKSGISKGAIAAAVVVPLIVIALIVGVAVRFWRLREAEKRKRWSQALSTHSNLEWEKGALPGEKTKSILSRSSLGGRPSMGARPSMSSYGGNGRPTSSMYAVENNMAGTGAGGVHFRLEPSNLRSMSFDNASASRSELSLPVGQTRQSRVSFAETTRPDRKSRASFGGDIRPAVQSSSNSKLPYVSRSANDLGSKKGSYGNDSAIDDEEEISVSPSQHDGPLGFTEQDLRKAGQGQRTGRRSFLGLGAAGERRQSVASALSGDDFKSAASARGSVDELRNIEDAILHRRSVMSLSRNSNDPDIDARSPGEHSEMPHAINFAEPQAYTHDTVTGADPDQMLALYAAQRAKSPPVTASLSSRPGATSRQNSVLKIPFFKKSNNSSLDKGKGKINEPQVANVGEIGPPVEMKSYVHLNDGIVSANVVNALPKPGPTGTLAANGKDLDRKSGISDISKYSEDD
ncbi:hypothetical protein L204_105345 [Cryptococcus depauperatus]|nr:hypothetical protein L204_02886 [Cryptococcus depauperatus CBS 7855]